MQDAITTERLLPEHWPEVSRIFKAGLATKKASFETKVPDWQVWDRAHRNECRIIARYGSQIAGWAALTNYSSREVYSGVAEVSIYVDPDCQGQGVGSRLMKVLIAESEESGIWTLQASIFPENTSSINLHKKHGFRLVGTREKIAKLDGTWRNVMLFERRK